MIRQPDEAEQVWLRFVQGRPLSASTTPFLAWCGTKLAERSVPVLLVWDNATGHISRVPRGWIRAPNHHVKQDQKGGRILPCWLPVKSPWLNPIEPTGVHSKRAIVEPVRLLTALEVGDRVWAYLGCAPESHLSIPMMNLDSARGPAPQVVSALLHPAWGHPQARGRLTSGDPAHAAAPAPPGRQPGLARPPAQ